MESPVRIISGLLFLYTIFITIIVINSFPNQNTQNNNTDENSLEQTTRNFKYNPRNNSKIFQRKNSSILESEINNKNITVAPETTINYGNKINFRGSVKYFATRPPFIPKIPPLKRNITKSENIKTDEDKHIYFNPSTHQKLLYKKKNDTFNNTDLIESNYETNFTTLPNELTDDPRKSSTNRNESKKSLNFEFDIDKYTSEYHHTDNNYSPDVEHFIPENVSEYFVNVGLPPINTSKLNNYIPTNDELTTPIIELFDKQYKRISDSIQQNIADSQFHNDKIQNENIFKKPINFNELKKLGDNNATIKFKNTKEILLTDNKDFQSTHKDFLNSNETEILFEMSSISTENYDQIIGSIPYKKNKNIYSNEITTSIPNEIIAPSSKRKINNVTKRFDQQKYNETRKEFLSTIRMRAHSTPRPKIRISSNNGTFNQDKLISIKNITATKSSPIFKTHSYTRKKINTTYGTAPANIDPVYQADNSPTRILYYTKSDNENSIPALNKRGSTKYFELTSNDNNTSISKTREDTNLQFSLPPTAAAWALISMKNTPVGKKVNNKIKLAADSTPTDITIKTEDDLQTLDKVTDRTTIDTKSDQSNKQEVFKKLLNNSIPKSELDILNHKETENNDTLDYDKDDQQNKNVIKSESENINQFKSKPDDDNINKSTFESITKLPSTITTPLYDTEYLTTDFESDEIIFNTEDNSTETEISSFDTTELTTTETEFDITSPLENFSEPFHLETKNDTNLFSKLFKYAHTTTPNIEILDDSFIFKKNSEYSNIESSTINYNATEIFEDEEILTEDYTENIKDVFNSTENNMFNISNLDETTNFKNMEIMSDVTTILNNETINNLEKSNIYQTTDMTTSIINNLDIYSSTAESSNILHDIEAAATVFYTSSPNKSENIVSLTTENYSTLTNNVTVTTENVINTNNDLKIVNDLMERKENTSDNMNENFDETSESTKMNIDSNEISIDDINKNLNLSEQDDFENDFQKLNLTYITNNKINDNQDYITTISTENSNIEIIKSDVSKPYHGPGTQLHDTTLLYDDFDPKYDDIVDGSGAIAVITISIIGVIALLLLVGLLMVIRGRRRSGGYGQRCTPVSLDSYSLDNVSVGGSTRRKNRRSSKRSYGNPAYDESCAASHPMQFAALVNFALDQDSIVNEFNEIPVTSVKSDEVPPGCESKNRYSNVIPFPETRVMLTQITGDETSEYINANYVRGPKCFKNYYIACQAPLASTVNDFWRMVWEQNSRVILMLTELMENGVEKCFEYLPPSEVSDNKRIYGDYQIIVKKREVREKYVISILQIKSLSSYIYREITHMWYFWPAKGVPDECLSIIAYLLEARSYLKASQNSKQFNEDGQELINTINGSMVMKKININDQEENSNGENDVHVYNVQKGEQQIKNGNMKNSSYDYTEGRKKGGPLVVHCSPGTGRTGAIIACDIGIRDFEINRTVDVPKTVYRIRRDRANAVQTKDQYIFIYKVLSEYATKLTGGMLDTI